MAGYDYSRFRDKLRDEFERGQSSGAEMLILKDRAAVRILTWVDTAGEERMFSESPVHFGITKQPINCPQGAQGYCPICEAGRIAKASGDPDEEKWAQSVEARRRFLFNVVNMDVQPEQRKVQVLTAPYSLKQAILALYTDPEYEKAIFLEGRDLILTRTGTGLQTEYNAKIKISATPFDDTLMDDVFDLDGYVKVEDADTLGAYLGSRNPEPREKPQVAREARGTARSRVAAPAKEEEPFPEHEAPPARRAAGLPGRRAASAAAAAEPDPNIDPVTGLPFEEEPPTPPPSRRAAGKPAQAAPAPAARPAARRGR
jgi:hypothetical protein